MDKIFHPNERAWISEPFQLEEAFGKLNMLVNQFLPFNNHADINNETELLPIMQDPSKVNLSISEQLSNYLKAITKEANKRAKEANKRAKEANKGTKEANKGTKGEEEDFFKVKIRDDEMYTTYNYGAPENSTSVQEVSFGKELMSSFNDADADREDDTISEWSLDDMDDDEMEPRWKNYGTEKLKGVVERHTIQVEDDNMDGELGSASEEDSDVNVISDESEDEELIGVTEKKIDAQSETEPSTTASNTQFPIKPEPEDSTAIVKEDDEFKDFNTWAFKITKQESSKLELHQMKMLSSLSGTERTNYERMIRQVDPQLASVQGETFQDDPIKAHSSMPVLASPISKKAKSTLQTLAIYISHQDDPTGFHWKSSTVQQQINEDIRSASLHNRQTSNSQKCKIEETEDMDQNTFVDMQNDFVVTVSFFHPKDTDNAAVDGIHKYLEPKLAMELTLLNTNTLSDLREAFRCENDLAVLEEVEHPRDYVESEFSQKSVKTLFPSGMILVNNTIYTDNSSTDYCTMINAWAESQPHKEIGPFQHGELNTQIKDLNLRFGYPYVYIHQGSCEHIVVFNAARKLHSQDYNLRSAYPYVEGQIIFKTINCRVDNEYIARWAVLDCKRFPENPMLICTQCLENYCYDEDGNKVGNFSLYPFKQVANTI